MPDKLLKLQSLYKANNNNNNKNKTRPYKSILYVKVFFRIVN